MGQLKEDNKFKLLSCRVRNDMEIYSPRKLLGFVNQESNEIIKINSQTI